jgi:hypothetical protein
LLHKTWSRCLQKVNTLTLADHVPRSLHGFSTPSSSTSKKGHLEVMLESCCLVVCRLRLSIGATAIFSAEIRRNKHTSLQHGSIFTIYMTFEPNLILETTFWAEEKEPPTESEHKPTSQNDFLEQDPISNKTQHIPLHLQHTNSHNILLPLHRPNPLQRIQTRLAMELRFTISASPNGPSSPTQPIQHLPTHNLQLQIPAPPDRRPLLDA